MNIQNKFSKVELNKSLKELNTFRVGGTAKYFLSISGIEELSDCIKYCNDNNLEFLVLGWGSNILISDNGFSGIILKIKNQELSLRGDCFYVGAGVALSNFLKFSLDNSYVGAEFLAGIPGTIGGAIYGNAGYGIKSISDIVRSVKIVDEFGEIKEITNQDCNFLYRESVFKKNKDIIYETKIILENGDVRESRESIKQKIQERNSKQPLEYPSAGSFFKNIDINDEIRNRLSDLDVSIFEKSGKIPAGFLIENLGLKGFRIGGAMVSEKHANFLINYKNATATDVYNLARHIKEAALDKFGIQLEEEVQYIGF